MSDEASVNSTWLNWKVQIYVSDLLEIRVFFRPDSSSFVLFVQLSELIYGHTAHHSDTHQVFR